MPFFNKEVIYALCENGDFPSVQSLQTMQEISELFSR